MICQTRAHVKPAPNALSVSRLMWRLIDACLDEPRVRRAGNTLERHRILLDMVPQRFLSVAGETYTLEDARSWFNKITTERFRLMQPAHRARAVH